jgi:hypothetical protein
MPKTEETSTSTSTSIPDKIKRLEAAAATLNTVSDELGASVTAVETALKRLNLGVPAWYKFAGDLDSDTAYYWKHEIGYAKVGGQWGIALRTDEGFADDPSSQSEERWPFDDAPRALRLEAIDHVPALLDELIKEAASTAEKIKAKVAPAERVAAAITASVTQRFDRQRRRR